MQPKAQNDIFEMDISQPNKSAQQSNNQGFDFLGLYQQPNNPTTTTQQNNHISAPSQQFVSPTQPPNSALQNQAFQPIKISQQSNLSGITLSSSSSSSVNKTHSNMLLTSN